MNKFLVSCVVLLNCLSLICQDYSKFGVADASAKGLQIGDIAPNFTLTSSDGSTYDLYSELKESEVAVVFYRGAWCPVCSKYLNNFTDSLEMLGQKKISPVFISPNRMEKLKESAEKSPSLTFLMDEEYSTMHAYDVAFPVNKKYKTMFEGYTGETVSEMNSEENAMLPVPATFLIGKDRKIKYVQFDFNYGNRAYVKDLLEN